MGSTVVSFSYMISNENIYIRREGYTERVGRDDGQTDNEPDLLIASLLRLLDLLLGHIDRF